jgi:phage baseplate assembly protein V
MRELQNAMTQRAMLAAAQKISRMHGLVRSYDPNTYSVKVELQPSGTLTGWIPIETHAIGNGWGVAHGPQEGDQAVIDFVDGDPESASVSGFIYSDQDRPPPVPSGELWTVHKSTSLLKFHNDGTVTLTAASTMTYTATEHHFVGPVQMDNTLNVTQTLTGEGGMSISGDNGTGHTSTVTGNLNTTGTITNNGHDIGSTHQHINSGGTGLGGVPQ